MTDDQDSFDRVPPGAGSLGPVSPLPDPAGTASLPGTVPPGTVPPGPVSPGAVPGGTVPVPPDHTRVSRQRRWAVSSLVPGLAVLRGYRREWLRPDVLAGITVAAYAVPQVMAYAQLAGVPAAVGLFSIMAPLALYTLLGSSRQLSVGPESTTALLTATVVAPLAVGDPSHYAGLVALLALLVGGFSLIARLFRIGFIADLLSRPVLVGYLAGVAVTMIVGQLTKITGVPTSGDSMLAEAWSFMRNIDAVDPAPTLLAGAVLAFLLVVGRVRPRWPGPLLAVLLAAFVVWVADLRGAGIAVVGALPPGLPVPALPVLDPDDIAALALPALGVAIVGFTDNVLTARSFAARGGYEIDANSELLALGAGNVGSALVGGIPVSSSGSRTALGDAVGSRTQVHSLVALGGILLTVLVFGGVLAYFPQAALGAIVVYAATRLIEVAEFRRLARFRRAELALAGATTLGVLSLDILYGVAVAVALSVVELLSRVARPHDAIQGFVPGLAGMHDIDDYPTARLLPGLLVYRYDSPLFFANAQDFRRRALAAVDEAREATGDPVRWVVLNVEGNVEVDITALDALEQLRAELAERGVVVALARVKQDLRDALDAAGLTARIGADRMFPTLPTAVDAYRTWTAGLEDPPADNSTEPSSGPRRSPGAGPNGSD